MASFAILVLLLVTYILPADEVLAVYPIHVAFYILYFEFYLASDVVVA